ncbi:MAG: hypothetical protein WC942_03415 [Clostridia bacterium]|jgi:hypothetical protein
MVLDDFPTIAGSKREDKIIEAVRNGTAQYNFADLIWKEGENEIKLRVFEDALKIDGVRINVTAKTQQQIADLLNCILPTAKIYDIVWHLCPQKLQPHPRQISTTTKAMIEHSQAIDKTLKTIPNQSGIKSTIGKTWIIDNSLVTKPGKACNYGWHILNKLFSGIKGSPCASLIKNPNTNVPWHMIQSRGWAHDINHVDYSQICFLVDKKCWINNKPYDIIDVLQDTTLSSLINHNGVLSVFRQPGVPELDPLVSKTIIPPSIVEEELITEEEPVSSEKMFCNEDAPTKPDIIPVFVSIPADQIKPTESVGLIQFILSMLKKLFG